MTVAIVRNCWTFMLFICVVQMDDCCHCAELLDFYAVHLCCADG